jgi:radical SAM-linked protein
MSFLEAVFARGDEQLAGLIEEAWRCGCRLDGWSEFFDFNKWQLAMEKTGIDGAFYAERRFSKDDPLPWDNIDIGVSRDFLFREYSRAVDEVMTPNCNKTCSACGLQCRDIEGSAITVSCSSSETALQEKKLQPDAEPAAAESGNIQPQPRLRIRSCFSKTGMLRYLSHLELITAVTRALRRTEVPVDYTKGFHPNPDVSFGPPLNVGVAGTSEYFDMVVFAPFDVQLYRTLLNSTLPDGIWINDMRIIPSADPSLSGFVSRYEFIICFPISSEADASETSVPVPPDSGRPIIVMREGKETDISPCIESVEKIDPGDESVRAITDQELAWAWRVILKETDSVRVRLGEITQALLGKKVEGLEIIRTGMYGWKDGWRKPL